MNYTPKGGRPSKTLPCPDADGNHVLRNREERGEVVTRCQFCARTWADLGTEMRAAIGWSNGGES
jgi:hypothetical protein